MKTKFVKIEVNGQFYWRNSDTGEMKLVMTPDQRLVYWKRKLEELQAKVENLEAEIRLRDFKASEAFKSEEAAYARYLATLTERESEDLALEIEELRVQGG